MIHKLRFAPLLAGVLASAALAPSAAHAQPSADVIQPNDPELVPPPTNDPSERAREFFIRGRKNYDLARFNRAISLFTKAYEEMPDGAFLFNIAQAYRQLGNCKDALFYYKRFLSVAKTVSAAQKKEVDGHIEALTKCVKDNEEIKNRPPDGINSPQGGTGNTGGGGGDTTTGGGGDTTTGGGGDTTTGGGGDRVGDTGGGGGPIDDGGDDGGDDGDGVTPSTGPKLLALFVHGGAVRFAMSGAYADRADYGGAQVVGGGGLSAGYPIAVNPKLGLDVGVGFGFTAVPWSSQMASGTSSLIRLAAHGGATFEVAPKIGVRGEFDVGVLLFTGLAEGNPFTAGGVAATGAISMLAIRAGVSGEYMVNKNLSVVATPIAFNYSPAHQGFKDNGIDAFTGLEFQIGLGYRM